jgi:hypothetical protein
MTTDFPMTVASEAASPQTFAHESPSTTDDGYVAHLLRACLPTL